STIRSTLKRANLASTEYRPVGSESDLREMLSRLFVASNPIMRTVSTAGEKSKSICPWLRAKVIYPNACPPYQTKQFVSNDSASSASTTSFFHPRPQGCPAV